MIPVTIPCGNVISAQSMYDFNPNFALLNSFTPEPGSLAAQAASDRGTICRWVNETSGETIDVSIARPATVELEAFLTAAKAGTPLASANGESYFSVANGLGAVQSFRGPYWVTVASVYFSAPDDAGSLLEKALSAID